MIAWSLAGAERLQAQLPEIGEGLHAALQTLHSYPNAAAAEQLAIRLDGARQHALQLAEALRRRERGGDG